MAVAIPEPVTLVYKTFADGLSLHLDIYAESQANKTKPRPTIVFFHGGALIALNRKAVSPYIVQAALTRGWMLISVDYRLLPQANGLDILSDVNSAWGFILGDLGSIRPEFSVDKDVVVVAGQSAGGYLSYLAASHVQPKPAAVINIYGPSLFGKELSGNSKQPGGRIIPRDQVAKFLDGPASAGYTPAAFNPFRESPTDGIEFDKVLTGEPDPNDRGVLVGYLLQENLFPEVLGRVQKLDTLNYMTKDFPPTVIIHGTKDSVVPFEASQEVAARLEEVGGRVKLIAVPEADHAFDHFARATDTKTSKLWSSYLAPAFDCMDEFLTK